MNVIDALIMGIVQGLAEYLPISSSGHLEIFHKILGLELSGGESLEFDLALHVATVLSTIVVLRREFLPLCKSFFTLKRDSGTTYVWKLIVSAIPVALVGLCFKDFIETLFGGQLTVVGICLLVTAALLAFAYFTRTRKELDSAAGKDGESGRDISWTDAFVIGCAQAVAVLPGLSRSGSTIATGILLGNKRAKLAQFSFFMVIIPILGQALIDMMKMLKPAAEAEPATAVGGLALTVGFISAFVVGCLACKWMIALVKKGKLVWFSLYCLLAGVLCLIF